MARKQLGANTSNTNDAVSVNGSQTLTNKTLTGPKIANAGYIADANGNEQIIFTTTPSAVNEITVQNAATGGAPLVAATGGDTDIALSLKSKGATSVQLLDTNNGVKFATSASVIASAVNYPYAQNAATGGAAVLGSWGADTDVDMNLITKGNGLVKVEGVEVATISGAQTLTGKTLTTPTITDFTNATHNHTNAAGGGQLNLTTASNATGTPSSATYLRGDNTWATISAVSLSGAQVTTTGASNAGKYIPLFQVGFGTQGDTTTVAFSVVTNIDVATAQLVLFAKQTAAMNNDPVVSINMISNNTDNIDISQFVGVVTTKTVSATIVTVYGQPSRSNEIWEVHYIGADNTGTATAAALTAQSYTASLPGGTQFTTSYINLPIATPTTSKHAATKGYVDSGTTTLTNKWVQPRLVTPSIAGTYTIDVTTTDMYKIAGQNAAITSLGVTGTAVDGQKLMIRIKDDGTARAITWSASFQSSGAATLLSTTVAGKVHHIGLVYDSAAGKWVCIAVDTAGY